MPEHPYFYLSFVDTTIPYTVENDYPGGPRWAGACFVPGRDIGEAASNAWSLGCNPGGEVQGFGPIDGDQVLLAYKHRLLNRADLDQMGLAYGFSGDDLEPMTVEELDDYFGKGQQ